MKIAIFSFVKFLGMNKIIKLFFITVLLLLNSVELTGQTKSEKYLKHSESYYWLSRSRNNAVYEAKIALKYIDSAEFFMKRKGSSTDTNLLTDIQGKRNEIEALIEVSEGNINGKYPIFMHLNKELDDQYELRDDALETAIESGIQSLLDANNNKTNKPLNDLVAYCIVRFSIEVPFDGNLNVLREVAKQYLSNYSKMYVISEDETYTITKGDQISDSLVREFGKAFNTNSFGIINITLKDINSPLKHIGVGFEYYDTDKGKLISSTYVEAFKEDKNNWLRIDSLSNGQYLFFILLFILPFLAWILFRHKDQKISKMKDVFLSLICLITGLILGIGIFYLSMYILSFLAPGSDAFLGDPLSRAWPYIFTGLTFILVPQILFLAIPLVADKLFLKNYRDTFVLQTALYSGILLAFQLEYLKFFQSGVDLIFVIFYFLIALVISYLLSIFYINYYKTNASYFKLYEVPLISLLSIPLGFGFLEHSPDKTIDLYAISCLFLSAIPYSLVKMYQRCNTGTSPDNEIPTVSKLENLQGMIKRQLMDYVSNKFYVSFNQIHKQKIAKYLLSFEHKLSIAYLEGKSGIGKTSLMHSIKNEADKKIKWFYGDCDEYPESKNIPYEPFYQAFCVNEFEEDFSIENGVFYSGKGNSTEFLKQASPALALLPGINLSSEALINSVSSFESDLSEAKVDHIIRDIREGLRTHFEHITEDSKIVFILDDIHWIDDLSTDLLFDFIDLMEELTNSIDHLYFQLICISTSQNSTDTPTKELISELFKQCNSWERKDFNEDLPESIDNLASPSFCSDFLSTACKTSKLSVDIDLLELLESRIQKESLNVRHSLEFLDKFLGSEYIEVRDNLIVQKKEIQWNKLSVKDKEKESFYELFDSLNVGLLKYLSSAAYIGMEFEARTLSKLWKINRLDLLHLLLEAEKKGVIYDKNDSDDYYVFTSKKMRSSLRAYISTSKNEQSISQIVRDYHYALIKIELDTTEINVDSIKDIRQKSSFHLQKVAQRCEYIQESHHDESFIIYMVTAIKLFEDGKFDKAHEYVQKLPLDAPLYLKYPILSQIRVSQIQNNSKQNSQEELISLYDFLYETMQNHRSEKDFDRKNLSEYLDKLLEFNLRCKIDQFDYENSSNIPTYLHGLIEWYKILDKDEDRKQLLKLEKSLFHNPDISDLVKGKYSNSILGLVSDKKQIELLSWRFCYTTNIIQNTFSSINSLVEEYCNVNIKGYTYQQTEDLCFLGSSIFKMARAEKVNSDLLNQLGQKRILLNQVIGSVDGEYMSTDDLLNAIQDNNPSIDLIEQYSEFLKKFRFSEGSKIRSKVVFIYLALLNNQLYSNPENFKGVSLDPINEIIKKSLDAEPFEIESIYKGMQDEIRKKITFLKSEIKNKQILNVLQKLSLK